MKTVWRIEDADGVGPYRGGRLRGWRLDMCNAHNGDTHPGPYHEGWKSIRTKEHVFGFLTLTELQFWFQGFEKNMDKAGYRAVKYIIPDDRVTIGHRQVMFIRNRCRPREIRSLVA